MTKPDCDTCEQVRRQRDEQYERAQSLQDALLDYICRADDAERSLKALEEPEKIGNRTLYVRLVARILRAWCALWPMVDYRDPEGAVAKMQDEIERLRRDHAE